MLVISILLILAFGITCIYGADDLLNRRPHSVIAWIMTIVLFLASVGSVVLFYESVAYNVLIKQYHGEISIEPIIQSDTTYFINRQ